MNHYRAGPWNTLTPNQNAMGRFFFDKGFFSEKNEKWVSFESTPGLEKTKKDIYGRCVPCITNLYEQLQKGSSEIRLGNAYHCWKIVIVLQNESQVFDFLEVFERTCLGDRRIKGRFGSGSDKFTTQIVVFTVESDEEKDALYGDAIKCAKTIQEAAEVFYHRACGDLYHELLGDWRSWKETTAIRKPDMIPDLKEKISRILYWK